MGGVVIICKPPAFKHAVQRLGCYLIVLWGPSIAILAFSFVTAQGDAFAVRFDEVLNAEIAKFLADQLNLVDCRHAQYAMFRKFFA